MSPQSNSDSPTLASQFELVTRIGAGVLGFAYVSGYLIVNTYLSSFGINTDAIQVFKSKYIYVGFFYALMLSIVILVFALVKKLWDLSSASEPIDTSRTEAKPASEARPTKTRRQTERDFTLWAFAVAFMVIPTNLELLLFTSASYKDHLIIQCGLLSAVFVYQLTYFWYYNNPEWDSNSDQIYLRRVCCVIVEALCAFMLFAAPQLHKFARWYGQHYSAQIMVIVSTIGASFWLLGPLLFTGHERKMWEEGGESPWRWHVFKRVRLWIVLLPPIAASLIGITAIPYWFRWVLIQHAGLLLAVSVLGGVIVISIKANQGRDVAALPHEKSLTERVVRWVLRTSVGVMLYLVTTLGYAYAFYSHIPVQKEGGDYTSSRVVTIDSDKGHWDNMIVLSQDAAYLYVAHIDDWNSSELHAKQCIQNDKCGPKHWRDGLLERCGPFRPNVLAISQKSIVSIQDFGNVSENAACKDVLRN